MFATENNALTLIRPPRVKGKRAVNGNPTNNLFPIYEAIHLIQKALGLTAPWRVRSSDFDPQQKRLEIKINSLAGAFFPVQRVEGMM